MSAVGKMTTVKGSLTVDGGVAFGGFGRVGRWAVEDLFDFGFVEKFFFTAVNADCTFGGLWGGFPGVGSWESVLAIRAEGSFVFKVVVNPSFASFSVIANGVGALAVRGGCT